MNNLNDSNVSPLVTVIIVNWNGRNWLEQCLPTLSIQSYDDFEVVVIDNGSTDDSVAWLAANWPEVLVLPQKQNLGFAAANNIGIQATDSPLVVLLNNDTLANPGWLENLVTAVSDPDIGMVASRIVKWDQPELLDSAGIEVDLAGIAWNRGWGQPVSYALSPSDVFGPSAAAGLYRRQMLDEIGLFDEEFFAYYEDVDLAWRAQRAGWRCHYEPKACVRHWHSATGLINPNYKNFLLGRNKVWTILKNYAWPDIIWFAPLILFFDIIAIIYQSIRSWNLAPLNGRLQAIFRARKMLAKRSNHLNKVPLANLSFSKRLSTPFGK